MLCRSTSRPTWAPSSRANHVMYGAPASPVAPSSSTTRWASHSRRCTLPPRGWSPGSTRRSSSRAPPAASSIRPGRGDEDQPAEDQQPPRRLGEQGPAEPVGQQPGADPDPDQPVRRGQGAQQHGRDDLAGLGLQRGRRDHAVRGRAGHRELVEVGAQGADRRLLVDVADHDLREAGAQPGDQLRRGEAASAEVEEVVGRTPDVGAEELEPELGEPGHGAVQPALLDRFRSGGQRPGQGVPVHLPRGPRGQHVHDRQPWHQRGRHRVPEQLLGLRLVVGRVRGDVADEELVARGRPADRGRGTDHPRDGEQCGVDLARARSCRPPSLIWSSARPPNSSPAGSFTTRSPLR